MSLSINFWSKKKIFITGCTGFTGSWLVFFLKKLNAEIVGYSLRPPTNPNLFNILNIKNKLKLYNGDINDYYNLKKIIFKEKPDIIFHLAASPIVIDCFKNPVSTFRTNSFGVLNLLELLRSYKKKITVNFITSDKCYRNNDDKKILSEDSPLGGDDAYSASKAVAEIMVKSYQKYFSKNIKISTIRSGNIIGGGDWGRYRIITDLVRAKYEKKKLKIRNKNSTRPWQHIFDVVHAYLLIAQYTSSVNSFHSWNVAPHNSKITVKYIYNHFFKKKMNSLNIKKNNNFEKKNLSLDSRKIKKILNWKQILKYPAMIDDIDVWYNKFYNKKNIIQYSDECVKEFLDKVKLKK